MQAGPAWRGRPAGWYVDNTQLRNHLGSVMANETIDAFELIGDGSAFRDELCSMIEKAHMFQDLSRQEVELLGDYTRAYQLKKGDTLFREGEKGTFMCILVEGKIDVFKDTDEHKRKKVATIHNGRTIGEMSILDEMPHSATGIAAEPVKFIMITKQAFERLISDHAALANRVLWQIAKQLSLRLRRTTGVLSDYLE
jgi:CRP-like cAMP-binding protein